MISQVADRAGQEYWSRLWSESDLPRSVDVRDSSLRNHIRLKFDRFFRTHLVESIDRGKTLLEVGCARSVWLGYFAKEHGLRVHGLDYSAIGCEQSRAILDRDSVRGDIIQGDLFDDSIEWTERFDFIVSFGVVEHFEDTTGAITALRRLLKPGGRMYTLIPNQVGLLGAVQRRLDERFFRMHVPLDELALREVHEKAGLDVVHSGYFLSSNFGVLNHSTFQSGSAAARVRSAIRSLFVAMSAGVWITERVLGMDLPTGRTFSPYIHCIAQNPDAPAH